MTNVSYLRTQLEDVVLDQTWQSQSTDQLLGSPPPTVVWPTHLIYIFTYEIESQ